MDESLRDLYQATILDHGRNPRNHRLLEKANRTAHAHNPLCGDTVDVFLEVDGDADQGVVRDCAFKGRGCAISIASASMMTEALRGVKVAEARALFDGFQTMLNGPIDEPPVDSNLAKLAVLSGVRAFPMRVKCATLAWNAMRDALEIEASQAEAGEGGDG